MKAERRHELKENDLAHAFRVAREYLERNGTTIGIVAIVVVAAVAAVAYGVRSRSVAIEDAWRRRAQLRFDGPEVGRKSLETLAAITQGVSDKAFVFSSLVDQAREALRLAQEVAVPPDRDLNEKAEAVFGQLLAQFADNPLAVGIARTGLATVEENKFVLDGDVAHKERADQHLAAIINDPAMSTTPFTRIAMDRRKSLDEIFTPVVFEHPMPEEPDAAVLPSEPLVPAVPVSPAERTGQAGESDAPSDDSGTSKDRPDEPADSDTPTPEEDHGTAPDSEPPGSP